MRADYEVYVSGRLGAELMSALSDLRPEPSASSTRLRATAIDQPSLHGILARLLGFGLTIEAIWRTDVEMIDWSSGGDPEVTCGPH